MEPFLNPHLGWWWFALLVHCVDGECPAIVAHGAVLAVIAALTFVVLAVARELWLLSVVLREQA
jgi:hypothetical protein